MKQGLKLFKRGNTRSPAISKAQHLQMQQPQQTYNKTQRASWCSVRTNTTWLTKWGLQCASPQKGQHLVNPPHKPCKQSKILITHPICICSETNLTCTVHESSTMGHHRDSFTFEAYRGPTQKQQNQGMVQGFPVWGLGWSLEFR